MMALRQAMTERETAEHVPYNDLIGVIAWDEDIQKWTISDDDLNNLQKTGIVSTAYGHWIDKCGGTYSRWSAYCSVCGKKCGCGGTIESQHKD